VTIENFDVLIDHLREAARLRNVLSHGSWNKKPDASGRSIPFFVTGLGEKRRIFYTSIDIAYLLHKRRGVAELACEVINTVTHMGGSFPALAGLAYPYGHPRTAREPLTPKELGARCEIQDLHNTMLNQRGCLRL
jgi:hypothetical protein